MKTHWEVEVQIHASLTLGVDGSHRSAPYHSLIVFPYKTGTKAVQNQCTNVDSLLLLLGTEP